MLSKLCSVNYSQRKRGCTQDRAYNAIAACKETLAACMQCNIGWQRFFLERVLGLVGNSGAYECAALVQVFTELEAEAYASHGAAMPQRDVFMMDGIPSGAASSAHPDDDESFSALPQHPWGLSGQQTETDAQSHMDFFRAWAPIVTPARRSLDSRAATNRRVEREAEYVSGSEAGDEIGGVAEALSRELEQRLRTGELHGAGSYGDMPTALAEQVCAPVA